MTATTFDAVLAASLLAVPLVAQGGGFGAQIPITTNALRPSDVHAADLDGDGLPDALSVSMLDDKVAWYRNLGGGSFGPQVVLSTSDNNPSTVTAADLDGDGDRDVLVGASSRIVWFENLGGGAFAPLQVVTTLVASPGEVIARDVDGDGDVDVLSASLNDDKVAWYENLGGGIFGVQQVISTAGQAAVDVDAADLDGDGDVDVVAVSLMDSELSVYENLGGGSFGPQQIVAVEAGSFRSVQAIDLDGDGDADLLTSGTDNHEVAFYENLGSGSFGAQQVVSDRVASAVSACGVDVDGDGMLDIAALGAGAFHTLGWFRNLGGGAFGELQPVEIGNSPLIRGGSGLFAADLDGDGTQDLMVSGAINHAVAWYRNWPTATTFGAGCNIPSMFFVPASAGGITTPLTGKIVHAPTSLTVVALGLDKANAPGLGALPLDLTGVGMTGCMLYHSAEVFGLATQPSVTPFLDIGWAGQTFPASAQGMHVYGQAFGFVPGANPLGVQSSNGVDWTISF